MMIHGLILSRGGKKFLEKHSRLAISNKIFNNIKAIIIRYKMSFSKGTCIYLASTRTILFLDIEIKASFVRFFCGLRVALILTASKDFLKNYISV